MSVLNKLLLIFHVPWHLYSAAALLFAIMQCLCTEQSPIEVQSSDMLPARTNNEHVAYRTLRFRCKRHENSRCGRQEFILHLVERPHLESYTDCAIITSNYLRCVTTRADVRFEVFTAVAMKNGVFWDVTTFGSCKNRSFGGTYSFHHQGDSHTAQLPRRRHSSTRAEFAEWEQWISDLTTDCKQKNLGSMKNAVFWVATPCGPYKNRLFGRT
jgi:hypothetical protein